MDGSNGGILASVTPKHRSEVKLDDQASPEDEDRVRVTGCYAQVKDQQLRVDMTHPDGLVTVAATKTDKNGRFSAVFDLVQKGKKRGARQNEKATYRFQAHIINAAQLAPADSNVVWYQVSYLEVQQTLADDSQASERQPPEQKRPSSK